MDNQKKMKQALKITDEAQDNPNTDAAIFILNEDCMRHIFSFLLIKERIRIQRVCKKWQSLVKLPWNDIKELSVSFRKKSDTEKIVYTLPILKQVLGRCGTSLIELKLGSFREKGFTKPIITLIRKMCPNLKSLDITSIVLTRKTAETLAEKFSDLTSIAIGDSCWKGCDKSISKLFSSSQNLRSVEFECDHLVQKCFSKLLPDLIESLSFNRSCSPEKVISALSNFKRLRSLSIGCSDDTADCLEEILLTLPVKTNLESLCIDTVLHNIIKRPNHILLLNSISYFINLRRLSLQGNFILHNDILDIIGKNCKHLSYLSLAYSSKVTDAGLKSLFPYLNLERLIMLDLSSISERSFAYIRMPSLKTIVCSYAYGIEINEAVRLLMLGSQNLRCIGFIAEDEINLNLNSIIEEASEYVENRSSNHNLKLVFHNKNLPETLHISKNLKVQTQNHVSDLSSDSSDGELQRNS